MASKSTKAVAAVMIALAALTARGTFAQVPSPFYLESNPATGTEFLADQARIKQLAGTSDLGALDKVCSGVEAKWSPRSDASAYFTLIQDILSAVTSAKTTAKDVTGVEEKDRLIHKYSLLAVNRGGVPVDLARILFGYLTSEDLTEQANGTLSADQWQQTRKERAVMWLSEWQELASYQSIPYDFQAAFTQIHQLREKLPQTTAGSDEQKQGLAKLWAISRDESAHAFIKDDSELFSKAAIRCLIWYYSAGTPNSAELQDLLNTYGVGAASQAAILNNLPKRTGL